MADMFTKTASETERGSPLELRLASVGSHTKQIPGEGRHDLHLHQVPLQDLSECVSECVCVRARVCVLLGGAAGGRNGEMLRPICRLNLQTIKPCGQIKVLCPEKFPKRDLSSAR